MKNQGWKIGLVATLMSGAVMLSAAPVMAAYCNMDGSGCSQGQRCDTNANPPVCVPAPEMSDYLAGMLVMICLAGAVSLRRRAAVAATGTM